MTEKNIRVSKFFIFAQRGQVKNYSHRKIFHKTNFIHIASISLLAKPLFSRNFAKKAWRQISAFSTMRSSTYSHNYIIIKLINVVLVDSTSTWDEYFRKVHLCEIVDLVSCYLSTYLILHNNVIRSIVHL